MCKREREREREREKEGERGRKRKKEREGKEGDHVILWHSFIQRQKYTIDMLETSLIISVLSFLPLCLPSPFVSFVLLFFIKHLPFSALLWRSMLMRHKMPLISTFSRKLAANELPF
jgi:hypothetical protein